jgi:hypothetical protein
MLEHISVNIRDDKRFSREVNEQIKRELEKRVTKMKMQIFKQMEKRQQSWIKFSHNLLTQ